MGGEGGGGEQNVGRGVEGLAGGTPQAAQRLVRTRCGVADPALADAIYTYRLDKGLSQADLSRETKISQSTISEAERGESISLRTRMALRHFLSNARGVA